MKLTRTRTQCLRFDVLGHSNAFISITFIRKQLYWETRNYTHISFPSTLKSKLISLTSNYIFFRNSCLELLFIFGSSTNWSYESKNWKAATTNDDLEAASAWLSFAVKAVIPTHILSWSDPTTSSQKFEAKKDTTVKTNKIYFENNTPMMLLFTLNFHSHFLVTVNLENNILSLFSNFTLIDY